MAFQFSDLIGRRKDKTPADNAALRLGFLAERLNPSRQLHVADVGANPTHPAPYAQLQAASLCHVWGFDPDPVAFDRLQNSDSANETILRTAVGDGQWQDFHCCKSSSMSSLFPASRPDIEFLGRFHDVITVVDKPRLKTERLDDLDNLPAIDFLKIDAQGAELQVLQNGRCKLKDAICVIVELRFFRLYEAEPMLDELDHHLRTQGYFLHKILTPNSISIANSQSYRLALPKVRNQVIDGDGVYLRGLIEPASLSDDQLKFMTLLSDSALQSFDLTLRCLDLLAERGAIPADSAADYVTYLPKHVIRAEP